MVLGISSAFGFTEVILFLLPGLVGVKAALWKAHRADWLNRIDTIAISFTLSLFSMGILYVIYSGNANLCLIPYRTCSPFLTETEVREMVTPLQSFIAYYLQVYAISIIFGLLIGIVYYHGLRLGETLPRGELWHYYFRRVRNSERNTLRRRIRTLYHNGISTLLPSNGREEHYIRVHTMEGVAIDGRMTQEGEPTQNRDIILEKPTLIRFNADGSETILDTWTGSIYIHDQGISHIQFDDLSTADEIPAKQAGREESESDEEPGSDDEWDDIENLAEEESSSPTEPETSGEDEIIDEDAESEDNSL